MRSTRAMATVFANPIMLNIHGRHWTCWGTADRVTTKIRILGTQKQRASKDSGENRLPIEPLRIVSIQEPASFFDGPLDSLYHGLGKT